MWQPPNISRLAYSSRSSWSNRAPFNCAGGGRAYSIRALHRKFDFEGRFIQAKMQSRGTPHSLKRLSLERRNMRRGLATSEERRASNIKRQASRSSVERQGFVAENGAQQCMDRSQRGVHHERLKIGSSRAANVLFVTSFYESWIFSVSCDTGTSEVQPLLDFFRAPPTVASTNSTSSLGRALFLRVARRSFGQPSCCSLGGGREDRAYSRGTIPYTGIRARWLYLAGHQRE